MPKAFRCALALALATQSATPVLAQLELAEPAPLAEAGSFTPLPIIGAPLLAPSPVSASLGRLPSLSPLSSLQAMSGLRANESGRRAKIGGAKKDRGAEALEFFKPETPPETLNAPAVQQRPLEALRTAPSPQDVRRQENLPDTPAGDALGAERSFARAAGQASAGPAPVLAELEPPLEPPNERTILMTGFEPFSGYTANVSQAVAERLDGVRVELRRAPDGLFAANVLDRGEAAAPGGELVATYRIVSKVLPVSFARSAAMVESLVESVKPAAMIMLGQSGRSPSIEIEMMAKNVIHSRSAPDADGRKPEMEYALPGGPAGHVVTAPVVQLLRWLSDNGVRAALSADAGTFVCNNAFYFALDAAQRLGTKTMTVFAHLPPATEHLTKPQASQIPHLPLDALFGAASTIAQWIAHAHNAAFSPEASRQAPEASPSVETPRAAPVEEGPSPAPAPKRETISNHAPTSSSRSVKMGLWVGALQGSLTGFLAFDLARHVSLPVFQMATGLGLGGAAVAASIAFIASGLKGSAATRTKVEKTAVAILALGAVASGTALAFHTGFGWTLPKLATQMAVGFISNSAMLSLKSLGILPALPGQPAEAKGEPADHLRLMGLYAPVSILAASFGYEILAAAGGHASQIALGLAASLGPSLAALIQQKRLKPAKTRALPTKNGQKS